MYTLIDELNSLLLKDSFFLDSDGLIIKEKVKDAAINLDDHLLEILLSNNRMKETFFVEKKGILIFDARKFSWIINNSSILPDSYTSYKNKIGLLNSNNEFLKSSNDVVLSFPYKDCLLECDSTDEDEDRNEIFLNEILCRDTIDTLLDPKCFENVVLHTKSGDVDCDSYHGENLLIKGNNLIALHSLAKRFPHKIKCMYWDILYNTDDDTVPYNDSFKHSSWLVMMKNRLEAAQELLSLTDGVICIQCDDHEQAYLRVLCDEVFKRESFINCICVKSSEASGTKMAHVDKRFPKIKDYILIYKSNPNAVVKLKPVKVDNTENLDEFAKYAKYYSKIIVNKDVPVEEWEIMPIKDYIKKFHKEIDFKDDRAVLDFKLKNADRVIYRTNNKSFVNYSFDTKTAKVISATGIEYIWWEGKQMLFLSDYTSSYLCDMWTDISTINLNKEGGVELKSGKKPEKLLSRIIKCFTNEGDIVLDAYFGTGTTGSACMKLNRKFIGLEQLDSHYDKSNNRLKGVIMGDDSGISEEENWKGGGSYISCELSKRNEFLVEKILSSKDNEIMDLYDSIVNSVYALNYRINPDDLKNIKNRELFIKLGIEDKKRILIEFLDMNLLYNNYSDIREEENIINKKDKEFTNSFYGG